MSEPEKPTSEGEDIEDVEDVDDESGDVGDSSAIAAQLMKNPGVLAALQDKFSSMVGTSSGYIESLPKEVKRRIKALKKLQNEVINIESEFYKEVSALELKYAPKYSQLFDKRKDILNAKVEPTDDDCDWPSDEEEEKEGEDTKLVPESQQAEVKDKEASLEDKESGDKDSKEEFVKGIPSFWLTVFKNVDMLSSMVQDHDEPIMSQLHDIAVVIHEQDPLGFSLEFHFESNEHFTDTVLTKRYHMRYEPDTEDPFSYEGPEIIKCTGCTINWNKGKNVTVKQVKKKQKHKGKGLTRTITKQVQADSFFNFFNPPEVPEGESDVDDETEQLLAVDYEIGHFIKERIVPRAVLYFTGEADNDDEYDDEDEEGEDDEYDEENDADFNPDKEKPADCKQQ